MYTDNFKIAKEPQHIFNIVNNGNSFIRTVTQDIPVLNFFLRNLPSVDDETITFYGKVFVLTKMIGATRLEQSLKNTLGPGSRVRNVLTWA